MDSENKIEQLKSIIENMTTQLNHAKQLLSDITGSDLEISSSVHHKAQQVSNSEYYGNTQIVEGVFNGQNMVGPDGKIYTIPANYASKSKLVEGDILKLTIQPDGSFIYKQIGPVERDRQVGTLVLNHDAGDFTVMVGQYSYKVIKASITYYHGEPGDEVVILTPQDTTSAWAAVENVIHKIPNSDEHPQELLMPGSEAELPAGDAAELPSGSAAQLMTEK